MNRDRLKGRWRQLIGAAKVRWGRLTHDKGEVIEGRFDQLVGRIQAHYGMSEADAARVAKAWERRSRGLAAAWRSH